MVTALMIRPAEYPKITMLCDDADYLDRAVSIDTNLLCSASVLKIAKGVVAIFATGAGLLNLKGNRKVGKRIITGTFYIVRICEGRLCSLTDDDIAKYTAKFWETEIYTDDEITESWFDGLFCAL